MFIRNTRRKMEKLEEEGRPTWQYYDGSLTVEMKNFIMETVKQRIDNIKLNGGEQTLNLRIIFESKHSNSISFQNCNCN